MSIFNEKESKTISSMNIYWDEVKQRDNGYEILVNEYFKLAKVIPVCKLLGSINLVSKMEL